ncbi:MAG TPA: Na+/H+ antiporter [Solirubrobacteraceae bacterium]|nr:Na+/H+ antiporter [Solirubrobacteraceae bacterium]
MASGAHTELVLAGLLFSVAVLVTAARVLAVPYPIFLVIGGLGFGLLPGLPEIELEPDLVLLIFLPPLLYAASFFTGLRDLRQNIKPISLLAIGLVLATALAVALVAHAAIDGMSWPAAFVLGAIVSPTDPVAATAIASRIGVPRRVVSIVEGEALINDATALVAYKVAVAAVLTGSFSALDAGAEFIYSGIGGAALGLAIGWVIAQVRERLDDPPVEITIALFSGYAAYLPAEELGLSGVTAAVAIGLYMGSQTSRLTNSTVRMQGDAVWQIITFLLNSILFLLIGLQLPGILDDLRGADLDTDDLILYGGVITATVIVTRIVWTYVFLYLPYLWTPGVDRPLKIRKVAIVAWMGMRGAVSLAAALALPATTDDGAEFDERPVILFAVFCVILGTLVLQGLTLPWLIRLLGVEPDDSDVIEQEARARLHAAEAALERIDDLEQEDWTQGDSVDRLRGIYRYRQKRFSARFDDDVDDGAIEDRSSAWRQMMFQVIDAQRDAIDGMRRAGEITDEVMRTVERDLDLEERRLDEARR